VTGSWYNTGDGHRMAMEIGAAMGGAIDEYHCRSTDRFWQKGPGRIQFDPICAYSVWVDRHGKRCADESLLPSTDPVIMAFIEEGSAPIAMIYDTAIKAREKAKDPTEKYPNYDKVVVKADTIEELARKIDISPSALKQTIDTFNAAVKPDGKALGATPPKGQHKATAAKIEKPPFYAFYPIVVGINHPLGGIRFNSRAQALDTDGKPIPGLYVAGAMTGGFFWHTYQNVKGGPFSGGAVATIFGRIAGENAAAEKPVA
jgi:tricarballylate dehydrogenase